MRKSFVSLLLVFVAGVIFVASCLPQYKPSPRLAQTMQQPAMVSQPMSPTATASPTRDAEQDARATMIFLQATDTAAAAEKTEMANLAIQQTQVQATYEMSIIFTQQAYQTAVMGTALATQTQIMGTQQATQTQGIQTAIATMTQSALTAAARSTQIVQTQKLYASVAMIWLAFIVALIGSGLLLFWLGSIAYGKLLEQQARHIQDSKIEPDQNGRFPLVPASALPGKNNEKIVNPNLSHRAVTDVSGDDLTSDQALLNAADQRRLEGVRALSQSPRMTRQLLKPAGAVSSPSASPSIGAEEHPMLVEYPLPDWTEWMRNWKPGTLALGINEKGLLLADPEINPHLMFAGTTGAGKTRYGVRTVVACALANGWQVVIAGKSLDYQLFSSHPNAHLVPFSLLKDPRRAVELLRSVYEEIERRDAYMSQHNYSLWSQTGRPRTMVVVDEFSNVADALEDLGKPERDELWRWARMDTAEARKYGVHMVYALQDPTARSIDLRIRRNTTPIVFRVKDQDSSRTVLNTSGAELLPARHFLASLVKIERGAAFAPTDDDIVQFLQAMPVQPVERPAWIDGVIVGESAESSKQKVEEDLDGRIRQVLLSMKEQGKVSLSEAQRQVYGPEDPRGGKHFERIQKIWMDIQSATATEDNASFGTSLGSSSGIATSSAD